MESRQLEILRAIVEEYVATEEPVGSKAIAQRHQLGISPATIRNEMALLEDAGLITQPHTSAGRIPTNRGYRLFVDRLATVKPLSSPERRAIETFLEGAHDLDDVVMRTVRLLAQLTKQVAVVQYPSLTKSRVRHVELIALTPARLLIVLITDSGRVEQRVLELPRDIHENMISELRVKLNTAAVGETLFNVTSKLVSVIESFTKPDRTIAALVISTLVELAIEKPEEKVVLAGTANLARSSHDYASEIHPILEALEEQVVLLRLLSDVGTSNSMQIRIGEEQTVKSLKTTSLVSIAYGVSAGDRFGNESGSLGALGIIGPTRMDYSSSMSAVSAVARYVGKFLGESK